MAVSDPLLVGIDLGAGSLKISIIKIDGSLVSEASAPVVTSSPHPGWSEQDPEGWWLAVCDALRRGLKASGRRLPILPRFRFPRARIRRCWKTRTAM